MITKRWVVILSFVLGGGSWPFYVHASPATDQAGMILLQVQQAGQAWYVSPVDLTRYYLGRPQTAYQIMRQQGLGITNKDLAQIPSAGSNAVGDLKMRQRLSGRILLQVEASGQAWYVYPKDLRRYYLGYPRQMLAIMRQLGLGVTYEYLIRIPSGHVTPTDQTLRTIRTNRGDFTIRQITIDLDAGKWRVMTDTGQDKSCRDNCVTQSLAAYANQHHAAYAIHGTYFCPGDYSTCATQINSYLYPVYNSFNGVMINNERIKYTTQPLLAFGADNHPYYFPDARSFKNPATFESTSGVKLQAAISNGPAMIERGINVLDESILDSKQATVKSYRGAIGYHGHQLYMIIIQRATVIDAAAVLDAMDLDYAINLDGGGSAALYRQGAYLVGPGRDLPNAILIVPTS